MKTVEEQIELLLRGTRFPDEVEGGDLASLKSQPTETTEADAEGEAPADTSLRAQMTHELREKLKEGRPLRVYLGADPTATSLHVGHFVPVQKLRLFQELGHQVIFLIGDYTALIGDPTGQSAERKRFTHEEVQQLAADYTDQVFRILDPKKTEVRFNSEWLSKLTFLDTVELATIFPLKWVVSRRDFQDRLQRGESLRLHETLYCLMQGYDAFALDCDVQIGGYDQYLNMLSGRWIQEHFGKKPHIPWTFPLLMGTDGRKMSKSFGNAINVKDSAEDIYGKTMRISDDLIASYVDLTTNLEPADADGLKARLSEPGVNPMEIKKVVATNLTTQYYDAAAAETAAAHFQAVVQNKAMPDDIEERKVPAEASSGGMTWPDLLAALGVVKSKGEARRLMSQGGFYVEQEAITDQAATYEPKGETVIRLGKRRYFKLVG